MIKAVIFDLDNCLSAADEVGMQLCTKPRKLPVLSMRTVTEQPRPRQSIMNRPLNTNTKRRKEST